jgi:hypothetical protein
MSECSSHLDACNHRRGRNAMHVSEGGRKYGERVERFAQQRKAEMEAKRWRRGGSDLVFGLSKLTASSSSNGSSKSNRPSVLVFGFFLTTRVLSHQPPASTMASSQQSKGRDVVLPTLDVCIQVLTIAKDVCGVPPAQVAFGAASSLLTMIRV